MSLFLFYLNDRIVLEKQTKNWIETWLCIKVVNPFEFLFVVVAEQFCQISADTNNVSVMSFTVHPVMVRVFKLELFLK